MTLDSYSSKNWPCNETSSFSRMDFKFLLVEIELSPIIVERYSSELLETPSRALSLDTMACTRFDSEDDCDGCAPVDGTDGVRGT